MSSSAVENHLKAIWKLTSEEEAVSTNALAAELETRPASVTDMLKKLAAQKLIHYQPYQGVRLTVRGRKRALDIVRKHRLWEVFLRDKLGFGWDEVHDIAEQLEHIQSETLTNRLDRFLDFPRVDPHGDPIPDQEGKFPEAAGILLVQARQDTDYTVTGVANHAPVFLRFLDSQDIALGTSLRIVFHEPFDHSIQVQVNAKKKITLSQEAARNILVTAIRSKRSKKTNAS